MVNYDKVVAGWWCGSPSPSEGIDKAKHQPSDELRLACFEL